jgi:copper homeostasis protein
MIPIEICAQSIESVLVAQANPIHRIELCAALETGGLTPSYGLIKMARKAFNKPIFVLIRPRVGDFCYSEMEIAVMQQDILCCKEIGVEGIVIGALHADNTIDVPSMKRFVEWARPMEIVFHRAFDRLNEFEKALEILIGLGVRRILTSGQAPDAFKGIQNLQKIMDLARGRIEIMVGGGITSENVAPIVSAVRPDAVHFSAKKAITPHRSESNSAEIQKIIQQIV